MTPATISSEDLAGILQVLDSAVTARFVLPAEAKALHLSLLEEPDHAPAWAIIGELCRLVLRCGGLGDVILHRLFALDGRLSVAQVRAVLAQAELAGFVEAREVQALEWLVKTPERSHYCLHEVLRLVRGRGGRDHALVSRIIALDGLLEDRVEMGGEP
jgi:hypothetical protein